MIPGDDLSTHDVTIDEMKTDQTVYGAKTPFKSKIKSVVLLEYAVIAPVLVGTMAALETIVASYEFKVETRGCGSPADHRDRYPNNPCGTTVAFNE